MAKIVSLNVRKWTYDTDKSGRHYWKNRYSAIRDYLRAEDPDIICLQEAGWVARLALNLGQLGRYGYDKTVGSGSHPIYVRRTSKILDSKCPNTFHNCKSGTIAHIDLTPPKDDSWPWSSQCLAVCNIESRPDEFYFQKAMQWVKPNLGETYFYRKIVCGNFSRDDIEGIREATGIKNLRSAREVLNIPAQDTFVDYNYPEENHGESDHFFVVTGIVPTAYEVKEKSFSDHKPIVMEFKVENDPKIQQALLNGAIGFGDFSLS